MLSHTSSTQAAKIRLEEIAAGGYFSITELDWLGHRRHTDKANRAMYDVLDAELVNMLLSKLKDILNTEKALGSNPHHLSLSGVDNNESVVIRIKDTDILRDWLLTQLRGNLMKACVHGIYVTTMTCVVCGASRASYLRIPVVSDDYRYITNPSSLSRGPILTFSEKAIEVFTDQGGETLPLFRNEWRSLAGIDCNISCRDCSRILFTPDTINLGEVRALKEGGVCSKCLSGLLVKFVPTQLTKNKMSQFIQQLRKIK